MDGIDLSWAPKQDDDYWKARNRQSLERYLVLDENGHVIGLRANTSLSFSASPKTNIPSL